MWGRCGLVTEATASASGGDLVEVLERLLLGIR